MTVLDNNTYNPQPSVATIGFFDGVHQGHRHLIEQVRSEASRRGLASLVVTFAQHPLKVIRPGWIPQLLTTTEEKTELLARTGVDSVALLHFDKAMQMMSAQDFMREVLLNIYNVRVLVIGYDHHFGHNRNEGFEDYVRYGAEMGIEVVQSKRFALTDTLVPSSTTVRQSLLEGNLSTANDILGYRYFVQGKVVGGFQNGRKLGFPTANISADSEKLVPGNGVYLVKVGSHFGMLNIGTRPTLENGDERSIEVHIFDFNDNIYEQQVRMEFIEFIRKERKFEDISKLQAQLEEDEKECRKRLARSV